jgi:acyl-CoA thioesterase YciA
MSPDTPSPVAPPDTIPSIRRAMMPRDTNAHGTIFGGVILAEMDLAAGIEARNHCTYPVVTVAFDQVEFKEPVNMGDVVSFHTRLERMGRTSMTIHVDVWSKRRMGGGSWVQVTEGRVTMVAVDDEMRPTPIRPEDA